MGMTTGMSAHAIRVSLMAALALLLLGPDAAAQKKKAVKDRVEDLETAIERIDTKLNEVVGTDDPEMIRERQEELEAKLEELTEELEKLRSESEEVASANEERDARMDALAEEAADTWKEVEADREDIEELKKSKTVGYDNGFFLASPDGKHSLRVTGFMKPYYQATFQKVWATEEDGTLSHDASGRPIGGDTEVTDSGFGMAATRLTFSATVFEYANFGLEIDYGSNSGEVQYPRNADIAEDQRYGEVKVNEYSLRALAAYGEFAPMPELTLRAGQFKVPFDKETLNSSGARTFTSKSLMTRSHPNYGDAWAPYPLAPDALTYGYAYETQRASSFGYDRGFQVAGTVTDGLFGYAVGVFNGGGPNVGNDNRDILVAARISSSFLAKMSGEMPGGMSDLCTSQKPHIELGAGFAYDLPQHRDYMQPEYTYNSRDINISTDLQVKWMGVSMLASFFFRNSDHGEVWPDPIKSMGAMAQLAYFNEFTGLEPAFRYSMYDPHVDHADNHIHEITGAINYYVFGNNLRLTVEWRGLFASHKGRSYLQPWGYEAANEIWWQEDVHEMTVMAQVGF